jgi:hypothetical protein
MKYNIFILLIIIILLISVVLFIVFVSIGYGNNNYSGGKKRWGGEGDADLLQLNIPRIRKIVNQMDINEAGNNVDFVGEMSNNEFKILDSQLVDFDSKNKTEIQNMLINGNIKEFRNKFIEFLTDKSDAELKKQKEENLANDLRLNLGTLQATKLPINNREKMVTKNLLEIQTSIINKSYQDEDDQANKNGWGDIDLKEYKMLNGPKTFNKLKTSNVKKNSNLIQQLNRLHGEITVLKNEIYEKNIDEPSIILDNDLSELYDNYLKTKNENILPELITKYNKLKELLNDKLSYINNIIAENTKLKELNQDLENSKDDFLNEYYALDDELIELRKEIGTGIIEEKLISSTPKEEYIKIIRQLKEPKQLEADTKELEQLKEENKQLKQLLSENEDLKPLVAENEKLKQLLSKNENLRPLVAENEKLEIMIEELRAENKELTTIIQKLKEEYGEFLNKKNKEIKSLELKLNQAINSTNDDDGGGNSTIAQSNYDQLKSFSRLIMVPNQNMIPKNSSDLYLVPIHQDLIPDANKRNNGRFEYTQIKNASNLISGTYYNSRLNNPIIL